MAVLLPTESTPARSRTKSWLWFNLFSLDAPLVAILWQLWFARCFHIKIALPATVALALTVWIIYASDRLLDVATSENPPATERHSFHLAHARGISIAVLLGFIALISTAALLRPALLRDGLLLSAVVALYFVVVHALPAAFASLCSKEIAVGILFALGTVLAPWSKSDHPSLFIAPTALFALLCSLNCAAIEVWEGRAIPDPATRCLARNTRSLSALVAIASLALLVLCAPHRIFAPITLSALGFLWLDGERQRLSPALLRVLADLPLLSPLLLIGLL